ncbi:hypothetical protein [Mycoplasmopsis edwardii]|uniref:Uncharacterized protein n=1 Tax=Mycoplasmopsis edwardii TaxID=53558 RepID=A0ACD4PHY6_9BACT|nr:hypothetical protein [Mycoplasmopsis edwardii]WBP84287.1 hypothetical protein Me_995_000266 [Mycoplasmopsis edwardii]
MSNLYQTIASKELELSFDLSILNHANRTIDIKINGLLRDIKYNASYFDWFIEDLLFLLDKNRYQKRWDYGQINIFGIDNLNLKTEEKANFLKQFKSITSFDLVNKE